MRKSTAIKLPAFPALRLSIAAACLISSMTSLGLVATAQDGTREEPLVMTSQEFLDSQLQLLEAISTDKKRSIDLIDEQLRVISVALALDDSETARELLIDTTTHFESLLFDEDVARSARKSRRTIIGKGASEKYFLGDPYEQLFAFLYLGMLDFEAKDFDFARASFAQAAYADRESSEEGLDVDCYMAFVLEGLANRALGRSAEAEEAFSFARRAHRFREIAGVVNEAFESVHNSIRRSDALTPPNRKPKVVSNMNIRADTLYLVAYEKATLSAIVNDTAHQAVRDTFAVARENLQDPPKKSTYAKYLNTFAGGKEKKLAAGLELLDSYEEQVLQWITDDRVQDAELRGQEFDELIAGLSDPAVNTIVIHQRGWGPSKYRAGNAGQGVAYELHPLEGGDRITIISSEDGNAIDFLQPDFLESVDYQATTRGAVAMHTILAKRVQMKNRLAAASKGLAALSLLSGAGGDNIFVSLGIAAIALTTKAISNAANTESDVRGWHELPKEFLISAHTLSPGDYRIESHVFDRFARDLQGATSGRTFTVEAGSMNFVLFGTHWEN